MNIPYYRTLPGSTPGAFDGKMCHLNLTTYAKTILRTERGSSPMRTEKLRKLFPILFDTMSLRMVCYDLEKGAAFWWIRYDMLCIICYKQRRLAQVFPANEQQRKNRYE